MVHVAYISLTPTDWDEYVYESAAKGTAETGFPSLEVNPGEEPVPFFYQPFFHFFLMVATGSLTIESARYLSAVIATIAIAAMIFATYSITQSKRTALLSGLLLTTDGWFLYTSGLVKLDTAALTIGLFGIGLFARSLRNGTLTTTFFAGLVLGLSADYKHIAAFGLVAVAIHWIFSLNKHKTHGVALLVGSLCVFLFVDFMAIYIGRPYLDANVVQLQRALGFRSARGLDADLGTILRALGQTYFVFGGSILLIVIGAVGSVFDLVNRRIKSRYNTDSSLYVPTLASSYLWAAFFMLVLLKMKNPHYVVILIAAADICAASLLTVMKQKSKRLRVLANLLLSIVLALNVVTLVVRATYFSGVDAMSEAKFAVEHLPADASILSEEPICQMKLATQTCTKLDLYATLKNTVPPIQYIVLIMTTTQKPPAQYDVQKLIAESAQIASFGDWKNNIVVLQTPNS
jgi:hypothetical protein